MTQEQIEQLLRPRYKVIADYPHSPCPAGGILNGNDETIHVTTTHHQDFGELHSQNNYMPTEYLDRLDHLFERLEWWEDLPIEQLPKYVKPNYERDFMRNDKWVYEANWRMHKNGPAHITSEYHYIHANNLLPATESEYLEYTKHPA